MGGYGGVATVREERTTTYIVAYSRRAYREATVNQGGRRYRFKEFGDNLHGNLHPVSIQGSFGGLRGQGFGLSESGDRVTGSLKSESLQGSYARLRRLCFGWRELCDNIYGSLESGNIQESHGDDKGAGAKV